MGKIMLPFLERTTAKGRVYFRYRRNGLRTPLPSAPTTKEFMDRYTEIHASYESGAPSAAVQLGSITALVIAFKKSSEYAALKPRVKKLYNYNFDLFTSKLGSFQAAMLTRRVIMEWRDTFYDRPAKANNLTRAISRLYTFGIERNFVSKNPIVGLRKLKVGTWRPWTIVETEAFHAKAPAHMRLALDLAVYTGQRLGDVIAMRWNHIEDNGVHVTQEKTAERLWIPIHKNLRKAIAEAKAQKKRDNAERLAAGKPPLPDAVTILTAARGLPYKAENLKHKFKDAVRAAGLSDELVFHGLRKTAAVMLAEAGCTTEQIKAITGHRTDEMVAFYVRQANQKVLAKAAVRKLERKK